MIEQKRRMKARRPFYSMFGLIIIGAFLILLVPVSALDGNVHSGVKSTEAASNPGAEQNRDSTESTYKLSVDTDRSLYESGDVVKIKAAISGQRLENTPEIQGEIRLPAGVSQKLEFDDPICVESVNSCPAGGNCNYPTMFSCTYEKEYRVLDEGEYQIKVSSIANGVALQDYADFEVRDAEDYIYVRVNDRFKIKEGQTAVVMDFKDIKIRLEDMAAACTPRKGCSFIAILSASLDDEGFDFSLAEGEQTPVFGLNVFAISNEDSSSELLITAEDRDMVDVKITPVSNVIDQGEKARYTVTLKDKTSVAHGSDNKFRKYNIEVSGLPYYADYPNSMTLSAGESKEFSLLVDTSSILKNYEVPLSDNSLEARTVGYSSIVSTNSDSTSADASGKILLENPSNQASGSGSTYNFRVEVFYEGEREDLAYAKLKVRPSTPPQPPETINIALSSGWNLISLPGTGNLNRNNCGQEIYGFVYLKEEGRYVSLQEARDILGSNGLQRHLRLNSFWAYSYEQCSLAFELDELTDLSEISLQEGWNFVSINDEMIGRQLSDFTDGCSLEKSYLWNSDRQEWIIISEDHRFEADKLYGGFLTKVSNSCDLGWGLPLPPELPE
jgi:hypothetical protein